MQTYTTMAVASTSKMTLSGPIAARARVAALPACRHRNARSASTTTSAAESSGSGASKSAAGQQQGGQWMKKQMEMMERTENRKTKNALKQDQDVPFALFVPPKRPGFTPFTLDWLTWTWVKLLNRYQSFQAGKEVFGWRPYFMNKKLRKTVTDELIPLYKDICAAQASNGGLASLEGRVSQRLYRELETADLLAQSKALSHSWRFGAMKGFTITSMRQMEFTKNEPVLQMAARIESTQSLETRDGQGALVRGSHAQPTPVTENYVFQRKGDFTEVGKWTAIKTIPTLSKSQAIGVYDPKVKEIVSRKRKPALTVV